MSERILEYLELASSMISMFAMLVIVAGFLSAAARYATRYNAAKLAQNFDLFKVEVGNPLTLGLEILIIADVIDTIIVEPTLESLAFLAFLVVIRTIVSWTLILEVEGHWPWQSEPEGKHD